MKYFSLCNCFSMTTLEDKTQQLPVCTRFPRITMNFVATNTD